MAVARRRTHHWPDPSSRVGWIRTERTRQASAIAASRVVTGAVPEMKDVQPPSSRTRSMSNRVALPRPDDRSTRQIGVRELCQHWMARLLLTRSSPPHHGSVVARLLGSQL